MPPTTRSKTQKRKDELDYFGMLSPELRNNIYDLLIPEGKDHPLNERILLSKPPQVPAICRTSRWIRSETLPIWRGRHLHSFGSWYIKELGESLQDYILPHLNSGFRFARRLRICELWASKAYCNPVMSIKKRTMTIRIDIENDRVELEFDYARKSGTWTGAGDQHQVQLMAEAKAHAIVRTMEVLLGRTLRLVQKQHNIPNDFFG
ncbi:hypothetical protein LTR37_001481 [Vermiconidia calcicola]|uniref:Uncharacterized protein n=1 Tax=Vermiconidia calcicola TaxID=1690605 RepID=A0ACC3NW84_9PEZI|nr:hypothetical protein LTR37_001481 [Vermiconidia calcicola]